MALLTETTARIRLSLTTILPATNADIGRSVLSPSSQGLDNGSLGDDPSQEPQPTPPEATSAKDTNTSWLVRAEHEKLSVATQQYVNGMPESSGGNGASPKSVEKSGSPGSKPNGVDGGITGSTDSEGSRNSSPSRDRGILGSGGPPGYEKPTFGPRQPDAPEEAIKSAVYLTKALGTAIKAADAGFTFARDYAIRDASLPKPLKFMDKLLTGYQAAEGAKRPGDVAVALAKDTAADAVGAWVADATAVRLTLLAGAASVEAAPIVGVAVAVGTTIAFSVALEALQSAASSGHQAAVDAMAPLLKSLNDEIYGLYGVPP